MEALTLSLPSKFIELCQWLNSRLHPMPKRKPSEIDVVFFTSEAELNTYMLSFRD